MAPIFPVDPQQATSLEEAGCQAELGRTRSSNRMTSVNPPLSSPETISLFATHSMLRKYHWTAFPRTTKLGRLSRNDRTKLLPSGFLLGLYRQGFKGISIGKTQTCITCSCTRHCYSRGYPR